MLINTDFAMCLRWVLFGMIMIRAFDMHVLPRFPLQIIQQIILLTTIDGGDHLIVKRINWFDSTYQLWMNAN